MTTRSWTLPRALVMAGALCAVTALAILSLFLAVEKRATAAAPDYRTANAGGVAYEAMNGRPLDPRNPVDRGILAGLPARDRRPQRGQVLYGAFISMANHSTRPLRSASQIDLRDERGHVYHPLPLPASNPYAYGPRLLRAGARIPAQSSAADENLAADGRLLVFRISGFEYRNGGALELVVHGPHGATSLII